MLNSSHKSDLLIAFLIFSTALFVGSPPAEGGGLEDQLLTTLRGKDSALSSDLTISLKVRTLANPFDPAQGTVSQVWEMTSTAQSRAVAVQSTYGSAPVFRPLGASGYYMGLDYDDEGHLIVWRTLERYALSEPDINDSYLVLMKSLVSPENAVVEEAPYVQVLRHLPGSSDNIYELGQIWLALGRGFSGRSDTVTSTRPVGGGRIEAVTDGNWAVSGTWTLTVDPGAEHLVRNAAFVPDGANRPMIVVTSSGLIESEGVALAKRGVFKYFFDAQKSIEISVEVIKLSVSHDEALVQDVRSRITSPLPLLQSEIVDYRADQPVRQFPGERE